MMCLLVGPMPVCFGSLLLNGDLSFVPSTLFSLEKARSAIDQLQNVRAQLQQVIYYILHMQDQSKDEF